MKELMKLECHKALEQLASLMDRLEEFKDESFVLDFCDRLNELSVRY